MESGGMGNKGLQLIAARKKKLESSDSSLNIACTSNVINILGSYVCFVADHVNNNPLIGLCRRHLL